MAWKNQFSSLYPAYSLVILIALSLLQKTDLSVGVQYVIVAFAAYLFTPLVAVLIEKIPVVRYLILGIRH